MRDVPFFRCLPVILVICLLFLDGCLGRSQSPRFYALSPITEDKAMAKSDTPERDTRIGIGPIKLADYLDQSKLVTRTGDNRLVKAEFDLWAGAFKDNLTNVLAENIGLLLPTERIFIYPWRLAEPMDYQIILDVVRLDGDLGKEAWLVARWSILGGKNKELVAASRSNIREPVSGPDYNALVSAQSRALAKLSHEIVKAIQAASRKQTGK
ncbi:MAG: PqiC family protein [Desulfobacterales bacterium]